MPMVSSFDKYDAELVRLRQLIARKHEHYPEYTTEQCIHAAIDELFDPLGESNREFRRFLIERQVHLAGETDVRGSGK